MTNLVVKIEIFVAQKKPILERFNVIAFTHAGVGLKEMGSFHLETEAIVANMNHLKQVLNLSEIMYLSTCNRVEFIFVGEREVDQEFIKDLIVCLKPTVEAMPLETISKKARHWVGINAVNHLIEVASSLDSMVLGEREIITQVRNAYVFSKENSLSGDTIRIVIRQTIETAKRVYTETSIAEKSVSVVSLAYQEFMQAKLPKTAKILLIGAGVTNQTICKFLIKDGYSNFVVFNRSFENAQKLTAVFGGSANTLKELANYNGGFDAIITCTSAKTPVLTKEIYTTILTDHKNKTIVDLAIPNDVAETVYTAFPVNYISVESLKSTSEKNLLIRKKELLKARQIIFESLENFKSIFEMRQVELKMREIPLHVKAIRNKAVNEIFSKELEDMDENSKAILDKILNYMEKKYVSVPMLMAKEMFTKSD